MTRPDNNRQNKDHPNRDMPVQQLDLDKGQTLADALLKTPYPVRSDCGGKGICGKCRVRIQLKTALTGANLPLPTKAEKALLSTFQLKSGIRLACQVKPDQPITLSLDIPARDKSILQCQMNPLARGVHCVNAGVAIDLGTTRIDLLVWDLDRDTPVVSASGTNDQHCHGQDVISRISAANDLDIGLARLQGLAVKTMNRLLAICLETAGMKSHAIRRVTLAGNAAMTLILAKINPGSLGTYPYGPPIKEIRPSTAGVLGLDMASRTPVYMFPLVGGFVGGDTISALIGAAEYLDPRKITLVLDIGTNGELVLCNGDRILATSCATGPAFEGAVISCGMPAGDGAIDHMTVDPVSGRFTWHVMGSRSGVLPVGLCGSGIVDALAGLLRAGILSPEGLLDRKAPWVTKTEKKGVRIELVPPDKTANGLPLTLSQKDIGEMQLAKAALCAGIELLLARSGVNRVDHTILTGAFGAGFDCSNAVAIGLLPERVQRGNLTLAAGLVGKGAVQGLMDPRTKNRALALSRQIELLDLSGDPQFQDRFLAALAFPAHAPQGSKNPEGSKGFRG